MNKNLPLNTGKIKHIAYSYQYITELYSLVLSWTNCVLVWVSFLVPYGLLVFWSQFWNSTVLVLFGFEVLGLAYNTGLSYKQTILTVLVDITSFLYKAVSTYIYRHSILNVGIHESNDQRAGL